MTRAYSKFSGASRPLDMLHAQSFLTKRLQCCRRARIVGNQKVFLAVRWAPHLLLAHRWLDVPQHSSDTAMTCQHVGVASG